MLMAFLGEEQLPEPGIPDGVYTVLVALIVSIIAPLVLSLAQNRSKKRERLERLREREEAAISAAERTDLILVQNEALAVELSTNQHEAIQRAEAILVEVQGHISNLPGMYPSNSTDEMMNARRDELRILEDLVVVQNDIIHIYKDREEIMPQHDVALMNRLRDRIAELKIRMILGEFGSQEDLDENFQE